MFTGQFNGAPTALFDDPIKIFRNVWKNIEKQTFLTRHISSSIVKSKEELLKPLNKVTKEILKLEALLLDKRLQTYIHTLEKTNDDG